MSPLFISAVRPIPGYDYYIDVPGPIYTLFAIFFNVCVFGTLLLLVLFLKAASVREKAQLKYIFLGYFFGGLCAVEYFSAAYGLLSRPPIDDYLLVLTFASMTYAIVRHRLMDIQILIKKTLVFTGLSTFIFACFAVPFALVTNVFHLSLEGQARWWLFGFAGIVGAAVVGPLNRFLMNVTDKYLFQKKVNYRVLLREASEYLAHVDSLKKQSRRIITFLMKQARIANAAMYTYDSKDPTHLVLKASRPIFLDEDLRKISIRHPLIDTLYDAKGPLELSQLLEHEKEEHDSRAKENLEQALSLMRSLRAEAIIPCFGGEPALDARKTEKHLRGILFLGHQKSDKPYTEEDLDFLFTLGQESSIAFENARLYDEALNKSRELQLKSDELEAINSELSSTHASLIQALKETEETNKRLQVTQASLIVAEKNATMGGMAKAVAHEVNNPLSIADLHINRIPKRYEACKNLVDKYAKQLPEEDSKNLRVLISEIKESSKKASYATKRIGVVIKTLTDPMRDTKGEMGALSLVVLCQQSILQSNLSLYEENLRGCDINTDDIAANVMILGNQEQLMQVFMNLIKNAYESMHNQSERKIKISGDIDPDNPRKALIEFEDNGPGIPPEVLPKMWKQGFSTKVKTEVHLGAIGQGRGLFICKHMIESVHNGTIEAKSEAGRGTTFILKLPLADGGK